MKYRKRRGLMFIFLLAMTGALALFCSGQAKEQEFAEEPYRIMIANDLHYLSPGLTDNGAFFTNMLKNGDGKAVMYSEEIADALIDTAAEEKPDLFILSGDLTFNGERQSHEELADKLAELRKKGVSVIVIPGNHDIDNGQAARFEGNGYEYVSSVSADEFDEIYGRMSTGASVSRDTDSLSYMYESVRGIRILMLDVNGNSNPGSVSFFKAVSKTQALSSLAGGNLSGEEEPAASAFADLNYLYFSGRNDLLSRVDGTERLLELLDDGSFLKVYVESMLKDSSGDSRRAELPAANHRAATRF